MLAVADGEEAVSIAEREAPELALLDVRMPGPDDIGALRRPGAGPATRGVPVVMMTANLEMFIRPPAVFDHLGIADLMQERFELHELIAMVDRVAGGGGGT